MSNPRFDADALGMLNVIVPVLVAIEKSVPDDPVANVNVGPDAPLIVVVAYDPDDDVVATVAHEDPFETINSPVAEL